METPMTELVDLGDDSMLDHIVRELRTRPFTMVLILALTVAVFLLWSAQKTYAKTDDLRHLQIEVIEVKYSVQKASVESQMRQVDEEYFRLERQSVDLKSLKKEVPALYEERMSHLKTDKEALKVDLDAIQRHINQITAPSNVLIVGPVAQ